MLGTTGSGKTTIARRLATMTGARHIELDALYWGPNWQPAEAGVFRERIAAAIEAPRWVIDGNYTSMTRDIHWPAADTIVWLDYPFVLVMWRLFRRVMRRSLSGEELWGGNRERLRTHFLSSDSLFNWARKTHWAHRKAWPDYFRRPELAHVRVVRLRSPRETERLLREIGATAQV
ncbi:MAG: adenylate kinase [Chloroflexi bacterium]|nr:adenylate kinase [Chloroflexota bacterium]